MMTFDILVFFLCQILSLVSDKYNTILKTNTKKTKNNLKTLTICVLYKAEDVDETL